MIKQLHGIKTDTELASVFNVRQNTVSAWRARKTIPYDQIVLMCERMSVSLSWLLTGKGSIYIDDKPSRPSYYTHSEIPEAEKDKVKMQRFIGYYWSNADEEERNWLKVQFRKCFPEYMEWLDKHKDKVYDNMCLKEPQATYGSGLSLNEPSTKYGKKGK
ncbi:MAG: helix-turn-helix domain-containing protein [Nitrospirae bacterium]|nr:helix-turn-helix domain-containing protein [Nitrospirota bacterium]